MKIIQANQNAPTKTSVLSYQKIFKNPEAMNKTPENQPKANTKPNYFKLGQLVGCDRGVMEHLEMPVWITSSRLS